MTERERTEAILRAKILLDSDYDSAYVLQKLLKDGFGQAEAQAILSRISTQANSQEAISFGKASQAPSPNPIELKPDAEIDPQNVAQRARALANSGLKTNAIYHKLMEEGYSKEIAWKSIMDLPKKERVFAKYPEMPSEKSGKIALGILMILVGVAITYFSYLEAASDPNDFSYIVEIGLIISGIYTIIKALASE